MKKKKPRSSIEILNSIRRDWGEINPVTKIIPDKKKQYKRKPKHRNKENFD